jgi:hypothetical protein
MLTLSREGIAAVRVTAFNNSAEFSQVGDVTFTTKNGTNNIHGSVFEYLPNQALDAFPMVLATSRQRSSTPSASLSVALSQSCIFTTDTIKHSFS